MRLFGAVAVIGLIVACSGGGGGSDTPVQQVANRAPVVSVSNLDQTAAVGNDFSHDASQDGATFSDADGDTLTITVEISGATSGLSVSGTEIEGVPVDMGSVSVTVTATDPDGASTSDSFSIDVGVDQDAIDREFSGRIDLTSLADYEAQTVPDYITKQDDGGNPIDNRVATLGRVLFFDTELSIDRTVSCASCHAPARGFSDPDVRSRGVEGGLTGRHSMRLVNTMFADERDFFWDERAESHEAQVTQPIRDHDELGFSGENGRQTFEDLLARLEGLDYYEELFRFAFLDPEVTEEKLQLALANFTKSLFSFDSRYDEGLAAAGGNLNAQFTNFTVEENLGKDLFMLPPGQGGAGCQGCHRAPEFDIAPGSGSNGVVGVAGSAGEFDFTNTRSPSLRDLIGADGQSNGPFMHDGSLVTLAEVIDHYDRVEIPAGVDRTAFFEALDGRLERAGGTGTQNLNLTQAERDDLVTFLRTLTGSDLYSNESYSDPFQP